MASWFPPNADSLDEDSIPLDMRPPQTSNFETESQPAFDSQHTIQAWDQGFQHQQLSGDHIGWTNSSECRAGNDMDPEPGQRMAVTPGGLTLPPKFGAPTWATRHIGQTQQGAVNTLPLLNGTLDDWASYFQPSLFEDTSVSSPDTSTGIHPRRFSEIPPLYSGYQNEEPSTATSDSFPLSFDDGGTPYHISGLTKAFPIQSSINKSPSPDHSDVSDETYQTPKSKRKRGRPKVLTNETSTYNALELDSIHLNNESSESNRVPHNQVEQKYRNGLNNQMERLRETVSTSTRNPDSARMSKAMVLAGAVEYIKNIEATRAELQIENTGLKRRNKKLKRNMKSGDEE